MYFRHGPVAYLSSVPRKPYVHLGLVYGVQLTDPHNLLTGQEKKQVRHLRLATPADLDRPGVLELLHESLLLDEAWYATRKRK